MKKAILGVLFLVTFLFLTPYFSPASARVAACALTRVGNPQTIPSLPPECATLALTGVELPPNLGMCVPVPAFNGGRFPGEYCKMPPSTNGAYTVGNTWGAKEMIGVLYTISQNWKAKYPSGKITIMDIAAKHGSVSEHDWGIAVDINGKSDPEHCVADFIKSICQKPYDKQGTIELGKMIVDTGYFDVIWYNDADVNATVYDYAYSKNPKMYPLRRSATCPSCVGNTGGKTGLRPVDGHDHHFHLDIDRTALNNPSHTQNFANSKLKQCQTVPEVTGSC
jgi:hypothetical protein